MIKMIKSHTFKLLLENLTSQFLFSLFHLEWKSNKIQLSYDYLLTASWKTPLTVTLKVKEVCLFLVEYSLVTLILQILIPER